MKSFPAYKIRAANSVCFLGKQEGRGENFPKQDRVDNADSAFIFLIILLIRPNSQSNGFKIEKLSFKFFMQISDNFSKIISFGFDCLPCSSVIR